MADCEENNQIRHPAHWRLSMLTGDGFLTAVAHSTVEDSMLMCIHPEIDLETSAPLKAVEDAVYANPLLLTNFGRTDVVFRSGDFAVVPSGLADETSGLDVGRQEMEILRDSIPSLGVDVVWSAKRASLNFFRRTFLNARLHHHLSPLLRYFSRQTDLGNSGKMYVHFNGDSPAGAEEVDVTVFGTGGRLMFANTFVCRAVDDAVFYILSAAAQSGFDLAADRIFVCGRTSSRDETMTSLRRFANYVMPVIFPPAMLKAGRDAVNAPFPLIILPLCE